MKKPQKHTQSNEDDIIQVENKMNKEQIRGEMQWMSLKLCKPTIDKRVTKIKIVEFFGRKRKNVGRESEKRKEAIRFEWGKLYVWWNYRI